MFAWDSSFIGSISNLKINTWIQLDCLHVNSLKPGGKYGSQRCSNHKNITTMKERWPIKLVTVQKDGRTWEMIKVERRNTCIGEERLRGLVIGCRVTDENASVVWGIFQQPKQCHITSVLFQPLQGECSWVCQQQPQQSICFQSPEAQTKKRLWREQGWVYTSFISLVCCWYVQMSRLLHNYEVKAKCT